MLRCASIYTYELDDPELALAEVTASLADKISLLEHSVGIVMCHPEFIASGVLAHICAHLPFEVAGTTTASQAVTGEAGELMLTIFVMTADDVSFRTGVTNSVIENIDGRTKAAFDAATAGSTGQPDLALIFPPFLVGPSGDAYVRAWGKVIPNTPLFGTLATDDSISFAGAEIIYHGTSYTTAMSFVLCYGNIVPRFFIATLPQHHAASHTGEVTKSDGPYVYEINHTNAYEYLNSLEYIRDLNAIDNLALVPFLVNLRKRGDHDDVSVVRGHASFTEDGSAIFRGDMDEGSTFTFLALDPDGILATARQPIAEINSLADINGALLFSCSDRRIALYGTDPAIELRSVKDAIHPKIPFMMGYSGGQICPTSIKDNVPTNRFHNYSLVMLAICNRAPVDANRR